LLSKVCRKIPFLIDDVGYCSCEYNVDLFIDSAFIKYKIPFSSSLICSAPKRKMDFLAGRYCAMDVLSGMYGQKIEIGVNADRSPLWPVDIVGSISHSGKNAVAVCAKKNKYLGIGIDCEKLMNLELVYNLRKHILNDSELKVYDSSLMSFEHFVTLVFSAKESLFKSLYPIENMFMEFYDSRILNINGELLILCLNSDMGKNFKKNMTFEVNYKLDDKLVLTFIVVSKCIY